MEQKNKRSGRCRDPQLNIQALSGTTRSTAAWTWTKKTSRTQTDRRSDRLGETMKTHYIGLLEAQIRNKWSPFTKPMAEQIRPQSNNYMPWWSSPADIVREWKSVRFLHLFGQATANPWGPSPHLSNFQMDSNDYIHEEWFFLQVARVGNTIILFNALELAIPSTSTLITGMIQLGTYYHRIHLSKRYEWSDTASCITSICIT